MISYGEKRGGKASDGLIKNRIQWSRTVFPVAVTFHRKLEGLSGGSQKRRKVAACEEDFPL